MRSTRLAILAVTVGTALLGWSTAGVAAVAGDLPAATAPAQTQQQPDGRRHHCPHRGGRPGV